MITQTDNLLTERLNTSVSSHGNYLNEAERSFLTVLLSFLGILGCLGNGIVVFTIIFMASFLDVPANIFILSQACADLGAAASISIYISHMYTWNWKVVYIIISFTWTSSLGSLFLLTVNRLISVADPLKYVRRVTPFRAKMLVLVVWMTPLIISLLHMIGYVIHSDRNFFNYGRYYITVLVTGVILSNGYMFRESRKQARKINRENRVMTGLQKNLKEDFKSVKTLTLVGGTFLLSCLPITLLIFVNGSEKESIHFQRCAAFFGPLMALNPVLDPIIYYLRSPQFRLFYQRFKRLYVRT